MSGLPAQTGRLGLAFGLNSRHQSRAVGETRKLAAILVADIVGYSRLASADEDRTLARVRGLRSDLIDPASPPITAASSSAPATAHSRVP